MPNIVDHEQQAEQLALMREALSLLLRSITFLGMVPSDMRRKAQILAEKIDAFEKD